LLEAIQTSSTGEEAALPPLLASFKKLPSAVGLLP
jgi:hypothetical protein